MRNLILAMIAFGCVAALSGADAFPDRRMQATGPQPNAAGPTLAAHLGGAESNGGYLHVEAHFMHPANGDLVKILPISLKEGETAAFSVPGYPEQTFLFARSGNDVSVEIRTARSLIARIFG